MRGTDGGSPGSAGDAGGVVEGCWEVSVAAAADGVASTGVVVGGRSADDRRHVEPALVSGRRRLDAEMLQLLLMLEMVVLMRQVAQRTVVRRHDQSAVGLQRFVVLVVFSPRVFDDVVRRIASHRASPNTHFHTRNRFTVETSGGSRIFQRVGASAEGTGSRVFRIPVRGRVGVDEGARPPSQKKIIFVPKNDKCGCIMT